jgi:hypothetical protein
MKVHRYIYTRLSKDLSPTGKNGFQSAFLPGDLLSNKEVLEIESHIHFPEGLQIEAQSVVFYKRVKGELYMVLLLLRPLNEVKDEHGRGGTFLCEGFLLAERDWRPIWRISDLRTLIEPHQFANLEALLASPAVDRTTGRIADLELAVPERYWEQALAGLEDEPEDELLMAMYHVAKSVDRDLAVVVEGLPAAVSSRLETCALFLPEALRPLVGWDDAFDGGKIFFSPLRVFGYSGMMPTTGRPAVFGAKGQPANWTEAGMAKWGKPSDPFSQWLLEVSVNPVPRAQLDAMYALSEAMVSGRPTAPTMQSDSVFEMVNKGRIHQLFLQGLTLHLDQRWAEKLAELTSPRQQLMFWMQSYQVSAITELLEASILHQNLVPEIMKEAPAEKVVRQGSPALQILSTMWTLEPPDESLMAAMAPDRIAPVLTLLFGRGPHENCPFATVAAYFKDHLPQLDDEPKVLENLIPYVRAKVPAEYAAFKEYMSKMAIQTGQYGCLRDEPTDWLRLLDQFLATTGGNTEVWKAAKQLGKTADLQAYRTLRAFALGEGPKTKELEKAGEGRQGLLKCLIEVHGYKEDKLAELGFGSTEIGGVDKKLGFLGKLKRLFGR